MLAPPGSPAAPQTHLQRCLVADLTGAPHPGEPGVPATPPSEPGQGSGKGVPGVPGGAAVLGCKAVTPGASGARGGAGGKNPNPTTPGTISTAALAHTPGGLLAALADMCRYAQGGGTGGGLTEADARAAEEAKAAMDAWAQYVRLLGPAFLRPASLGSALLKARTTLLSFW